MFGVFFFVSLYMQNILGYSAVQAGAAFLPMTVLIIMVAPLAGKASDRYGSRWLMTIGMVLLGVPAALLLAARHRRQLLEPAAGLPVRRPRDGVDDDADCGGGDPRGTGGKGGRRRSAVLNAMRQVGGSVGIALMGAIVAARRAGVPASRASWRASSER